MIGDERHSALLMMVDVLSNSIRDQRRSMNSKDSSEVKQTRGLIDRSMQLSIGRAWIELEGSLRSDLAVILAKDVGNINLNLMLMMRCS